MVETLVFETPTPLPEHAEREFFSPAMTASASAATTNNVNGLNDSGIELQEEWVFQSYFLIDLCFDGFLTFFMLFQ